MMSFFSKFFRLENKSISAMSSEHNTYKNWSKEQLIERLTQLEKDLKVSEPSTEKDSKNAKKRKAESSKEKVKDGLKKKKNQKPFDFSKQNTRFVAFKFAYLGWNYNGLAIQKDVTPLPTIEGTLLETMQRCKLIPSMVLQDFKFSRCGRTDKGVSAMNQVISLRVRSNLTYEEQLDPSNDHKEIQYVSILNQLLPEDIRISAVCLRPPEGFDARFSCKSRHYRYLFDSKGLDLKKMQNAAKLYEGEHDFRNFCKLDGSKQITNFKRKIISSNILKVDGDMYCFDLVGTAFLWHQVRCCLLYTSRCV